jgi:ferredoxin
MKLVIDRVLCQGYGQCEAVAPTLFQLDGDMVAIALKNPDTADEIEQAREAVRVCPRQAIRLEENA